MLLLGRLAGGQHTIASGLLGSKWAIARVFFDILQHRCSMYRSCAVNYKLLGLCIGSALAALSEVVSRLLLLSKAAKWYGLVASSF
jgi:hypothetical protein